MRRTTALAVLALLAAGCSSPPPAEPLPEITFMAKDSTVSARPYLHCDVMVTKCDRDTGAQARMRVPPGTPVKITVPGDVAASPWSVVVQYRTAAGEQKDPETVATFVPKQSSEYTVALADPSAQLQTVEVKQAGAKRQESTAPGDIGLLARSVWSLQVDSA